MAKLLLQFKCKQPRLTTVRATRDSACRASEFPHETMLRSLVVHQNARLVYAQLALETSRSAFIFKHEVRRDRHAETPSPHRASLQTT